MRGRDATEYYATGHHQPIKSKGSNIFDEPDIQAPRAELIGECYIGFQKLLNEELKAFDLKDSVILDNIKVASIGVQKNSQGLGTIR